MSSDAPRAKTRVLSSPLAEDPNPRGSGPARRWPAIALLICLAGATWGPGAGAAQDVFGLVDISAKKVFVLDAQSFLEQPIPQAISFSVFASSCEAVQELRFFLNGTYLGSWTDFHATCSCFPDVQTTRFADSNLLRTLWTVNGQNRLTVTKQAGEDGAGTSVAWVVARFESRTGQEQTRCLFDSSGSNCTQGNFCLATPTLDAVQASIFVPGDMFPAALRPLGTVSLDPVAAGAGDCAIGADRQFAFVTDFSSRLWALDVAAEPPTLAPDPHLIPIANPGEDVAITRDGKFAVICDGSENSPIAVVDVASRSQIGTFGLGTNCVAVDVCEDGSVLVASSSTSTIRRLWLDDVGILSDTGERIPIQSPVNVSCAEGARTGVAVGAQPAMVVSFTVPDLVPIEQRSFGSGIGAAAVVSRYRNSLYALSSNALLMFGYDKVTGALSTAPLFTQPHSGFTAGFFGIDPMALDSSESQLVIPACCSKVRVYAAQNIALLQSFTYSGLQAPAGVCASPPSDFDRDGLSDEREAAVGTDLENPDTDGDGLSDGFEVRSGLDALVAGDGIRDPDQDGLDHLAEQEARTDPRDPDTDGDGLTDGQELLEVGSDARRADTDGDNLIDGMDNCPLTANPDQIDAVHANGIGDACDDPDADAVADLTDNCPDTFNDDQKNEDGDRLGDACDSFPAHHLKVRPLGPDFALTDRPVSVSFRLEDPTGGLLADVSGARFSVTLGGSAVFGDTATAGRIIAGGGTNHALLEFADGLVTVDVVCSVLEVVEVETEDSEGIDIAPVTDLVEDFESGNGGFLHFGTNDAWQYGIPTTGPGAAFSGVKVWATNLGGDYPNDANFQLITPDYRLGSGRRPTLELRSWFNTDFCCSDRGFVEISRDGGQSWMTLESLSGNLGGYTLKVYELAQFAGSTVRIRFRFISDASYTAPGWYIDDFAFRALGKSIEFMDPATDLDGDTLTNEQELQSGTSPRRSDTDGDLWRDDRDNCPRTHNPGQSDAVHPNGIGDACEDPDADGAFDEVDNCPDASNPGQANGDGDSLGDQCDPFATHDLRVRPVSQELGLAGQPLSVTYRLEDPAGELLGSLTGARLTLTVGGFATFATSAARGHLLAGGGTDRVLVEFVDGLVTIDINDLYVEPVSLNMEDTEPIGATMPSGVFEDFEADGGGFVTTGVAPWQRGTPNRGPSAAFSGALVWATSLSWQIPPNGDSYLVTPEYRLRPGTSPRLEFQTWFDFANSFVEISTNFGQSWKILEWIGSSTSSAYVLKSIDLRAYKGLTVRFRFRHQAYCSCNGPVWYIDDFTLYDPGQSIEFLDPRTDPDGDGLNNQQELEAGTHPRSSDTDGDTISDGVDNCPVAANKSQSDFVHPNSTGDACDDPDQDGVADLTDNCPNASNAAQEDVVHPNGLGDSCDDPDADGVVDLHDNCPDTANPGQGDDDGDGHGSICDLCPNIYNPDQDEEVACVETSAKDAHCMLARVDLRKTTGDGILRLSAIHSVVPESLTFELNVLTCAAVQGIDLLLNGRSLGTFVSDLQECSCSARVQTMSITDSGLLRATWDPQGDNVFGIRKTGGVQGTFVAWVRVRLIAPDTQRTVCLYDSAQSGCSETARCPEETVGNLDTLSVVAEPLESWFLVASSPFTAGELPDRMSLGAVPDGRSQLCVDGLAPPSPSDDAELVAGDRTPPLEAAESISIQGQLAVAPARTTWKDRSVSSLQAIAQSSDCVEFTHAGEIVLRLNREDCGAPSALAFAPGRVECISPQGAEVLLDGKGSSDPDSSEGTRDDISLYEWLDESGGLSPVLLGTGETLPVMLRRGTHTVTLRVTDLFGLTGTDDVVVTVADTRPPQLSIEASPVILWPPNHRMVPVTVNVVSADLCDPAPLIQLVSVTNSEPDDAVGEGDGHTVNDIQGVLGEANPELALRAERSGSGSGRLYNITYSGTDGSGNVATVQTGVLVPENQGGAAEPLQVEISRSGDVGASTGLHWSSVRQAGYYNVMRGRISEVSMVGSFTVVENATCVGRKLTATALFGGPMNEEPPLGGGFFYLVEYFDGRDSGYGTTDGGGEVFILSGDSCH